MDRRSTLAIIVVSFLYLLLRFVYPETIEFGYDQPRLAISINNFLEKGNFINSQSFSVESPWGNFSWGPMLTFLYSPFLAVSKNPITASCLIALTNLLSVVVVLFIGWKFFGRRVGVISGILLATQPWWIIFSRMIYQPALIPTIIAFSMLSLFMTLKKPKSFWVATLVFSWGILLQTYLITFSFILTSVVILFIGLRNKIWSKKYFSFGIILNLIIYLPSLYFYIQNPEMFLRFFQAAGKYGSSFVETIKNFVSIISGGGFNWQLGYGYKEFLGGLGRLGAIFQITAGIVLPLILYGCYLAVKTKNLFISSLVLFLFAPLWAIPLIGVEYVVPRYFLYTMPSFCLVLGYSIENLVKKFGKGFLVVPLLISAAWILITVKYFVFIKTYSYPNGFLSHFSDVPYSFIDKSFGWISDDATGKGYRGFLVEPPNQASYYYINYILERKEIDRNAPHGNYKIQFSPASQDTPEDYAQFGPYIVYEVKN